MQSQPTTLLCNYAYDPLDRLTSHILPETPERQRFYCKSRLATEIQGAIRYSIIQHADLLLAQHQSQGDALVTTLLATDQQRSVLLALKDQTRQTIAYSPYGHSHAGNGLLSLLGFNGERPDPVTGHYLLGNGYRAFNPVLMRFNSPDNISPFGKGGLNSYAYCMGDPINHTDPTGHMKRLSRLLGSKTGSRPVYASRGHEVFTAKSGGSQLQVDQSAQRIMFLEEKAGRITAQARYDVVAKDTARLPSFVKPPFVPSPLARSAYGGYRASRMASNQQNRNIFTFLDETATHLDSDQSLVVFQFAQQEMMPYQRVLNEINTLPLAPDPIQRLPFLPKDRSIQQDLYYKRLESIVPQEAQQLLDEAKEIRNRVFN